MTTSRPTLTALALPGLTQFVIHDVAERAECESLATILHAWPGAARPGNSGHASKYSEGRDD
jgi:hypothetical protein